MLADQLEAYRPHLRSVPYRPLGLVDEADDAVQAGLAAVEPLCCTAIDNLDGWVTTVVAPVCLDILAHLPPA